MDATQKAFNDEIKIVLGYPTSQRLKKEDWEKIDNLHFLQSRKFVLNDMSSSRSRVDWDLHHIFKFTNLKSLSIEKLPDPILLSTGYGLEVFDYKFWFDKFPHLEFLFLNRGSYENRIESMVVKPVKGTDEIFVFHNRTADGIDMKVQKNDEVIKSFYFGTSRHSQQWFQQLVKYLFDHKELPEDQWYKQLRKQKLVSEAESDYEIIELRNI